jgi:hypothetical protein
MSPARRKSVTSAAFSIAGRLAGAVDTVAVAMAVVDTKVVAVTAVAVATVEAATVAVMAAATEVAVMAAATVAVVTDPPGRVHRLVLGTACMTGLAARALILAFTLASSDVIPFSFLLIER